MRAPTSTPDSRIAHGRLRRAVSSLIAAIGTLVLVELVLRIPALGSRVPTLDPSAGFTSLRSPIREEGDQLVLRPDAARTFNPIRLAVHRSPQSIRVVVVGGSSTYGFPYGDRVSHPRFLAHRLEAMAPRQTVEVANLGAMSYGSGRIRKLLPWVLELHPDLVVVDMGHNEFIEPEVFQRVLKGGAELLELRTNLARSRLYSLLAFGLERLAPGSTSMPAGPEVDPFGFDVPRSENRIFTLEEKAVIVRAFEATLRGMLEDARRAGVKLLLCTAPSNLRDWAPEYLVFAYPLPQERQREFLMHLGMGMRLLEGGSPEQALAELDQAMALESRHAMTVFQRARALEALGRLEEAAREYRHARDLDPMPIRALGSVNEAIRRVAKTTGTALVDIEAEFAAMAPGGAPGHELFLDYCHPTDVGHRHIADAIARVVAERALVPGLAVDANQRLSSFVPVGEYAPSPGTRSADVQWWLGLAAHRQGRDDEARSLWEHALEAHPEQPNLLRHLSELYRSRGEFALAAPLVERLVALGGSSVEDRLAQVSIALATGSLQDARRELEELAESDPGSAAVQFMFGQLEHRVGALRAARSRFETTVRLRPDHYVARESLGDVCRELGDRDCAIRAYQAVLAQVKVSPSVTRSLETMGVHDPESNASSS